MRIESRVFNCDPRQFNCRAACCRSANTSPALSVGDYLRMGAAIGEDPSQVWLKRGNIKLTLVNEATGMFIITLGLLHDPCTFLSPEEKCQIYAMRPVACGSFPWKMLVDQPESLAVEYPDLACLKNIRLTPDKAELYNRLVQIVRTEAQADLRYFWNQRMNHTYVQDTTVFHNLYKGARKYLAEPKPFHSPERVVVLEDVARKLENIIIGSEAVIMKPYEFANLAQTVYFFWSAEAVAQQLDDLTPAAREAYKQTTEAWQEISLQV